MRHGIIAVAIQATILIMIHSSAALAHGARGYDGAPSRGRYVLDFSKQGVKGMRTAIHALSALGVDVSGVNYRQRTVEVILMENEVRALRDKYNLRPTLIATQPNTLDPRFLTPERVVEKMKELVVRYPRFARLHEIGRSVEGRAIFALELATPDPVLKPVVLFDGMHHAREIMTPEIVLDIADTLLQSAKEGRRVRIGHAAVDLLSRVRVWLVPQLNPDGNHIVWTSNTWWRKNARRERGDVAGVDLNRNYSFQWGKCNGSSGDPWSETFRGISPSSEPETVALTALVDQIRPIGYLSYHSFGELVLAPYGCKNQYTSEHELLTRIGQRLADALPTDDGRGKYAFGTSWQLLYPNDGTSKDHVFSRTGAPSFTIEVNTSFQPDYALREPTLKKHRLGWSLFIDSLLKNLLTVKVKDGNGRPVRARLEFSTIAHKAGERAFVTDEIGVFFKVLPPGASVLRVTDGNGRSREVPFTMSGDPQVIEVTM